MRLTGAVLAISVVVSVLASGCSSQATPGGEASPPSMSPVSASKSLSATVNSSSAATRTVVQSPAAYGTSAEWAYLRDQRAGEGSGLTNIPASFDATAAARRIAQLLPRDPTFEIIDLSGVSGASWRDVMLEEGRSTKFRPDWIVAAELCAVSEDAGQRAWDRARPNGEYAVLMASGNHVAGMIMRVNRRHHTWEYECDQQVGDFNYLDAVKAARRKAPRFRVRFAMSAARESRADSISWALFRYPSGTVEVTPLSAGPPSFYAMRGKTLLPGVLYPESYAFQPFEVPGDNEHGLGRPRGN